jgi:hypothetical protein
VSEPRCFCGRVALYKAHKHGPGVCRRHRGFALAEVSRVSRALTDARAAEAQQNRESWLHGPECRSARWRAVA